MLRELTVENVQISPGKKEVYITFDGNGKLLKFFVEFNTESKSQSRLRIFTKEGEKIADVQSEQKKGVFYPRCNITKQKYAEDILLNTSGQDETSVDYFYFFGGLIVHVERTDDIHEDILIKNLTVLTDEN